MTAFAYTCEHCPTRVPMTRTEYASAKRVLCERCATQLERTRIERKIRLFALDREKQAA